MKSTLEDIAVETLLTTFLKNKEDETFKDRLTLSVPKDVWINHIIKSNHLGERMCLCQMRRLDVSNAYTGINNLCRIKLLELIVPFLLWYDFSTMSIHALDVMHTLKTTVDAKLIQNDQLEEPVALNFYQNLEKIYKKFRIIEKKSIAAVDDCINNLQDLISTYLDTDFFLSPTHTKYGDNCAMVEVELMKKNWTLGNKQDVKVSSLFDSDVTLSDIIGYIIRLRIESGISEIFIIKNQNFNDHILHLSYYCY